MQKLNELWQTTWFKAVVIGGIIAILLGVTVVTGIFRPSEHIGRRNFIIGGNSTPQSVTATPTISNTVTSPSSAPSPTAALPSATAIPRATIVIQTAPTNTSTVSPTLTQVNTPLPPPPPPASPTPSICAQLKAQGKSLQDAWMWVLSNGRFVQSSSYKFNTETLTGVEQDGFCQASNGRWYKP